VAATLAACSSQASTRQDTAGANPTGTAPPVSLSTSIPAGTTIRVGDQLDYLKTVLKLGGQDQNFPYTIDYSAFLGGPPMLQAFQAGALDAGFIGSTPLIFIQAGNQPIVAVAGWSTEHGSYELLTAPGVTDINGWKDLKGKKVAYQEGTAGEAALLQALDTAGLKLADITPVKLPQTQVSSALQGGSADAGVSIEPLTSVYLNANPTAKDVDKAQELTDRSSFLISTQDALADPAKQAAIGDYLARLVRAYTYLQSHPDQVAQGFYVAQYKLTPERASQLVAQAGKTRFFALPGDIVAPQQRLADLFQANGEVPSKVDVSKEFDPRYNALVLKEQRS
jgi:sulfonate transport system substrate-binding protein